MFDANKVAVGERVAVAVTPGGSVAEGVGVRVGVEEGVLVGVGVRVGVLLGVLVGVLLGVRLSTGVLVGVGDTQVLPSVGRHLREFGLQLNPTLHSLSVSQVSLQSFASVSSSTVTLKLQVDVTS